ncbi:phage tail protein [Kribbella monticola]|uniref:phage tail protein n=1 Tax=Kribbella monticola TaxID=2185285 RepID=UPI0013002F88|nr:phage tail protein [Kribbella monticola]
MSPDQLRSPYPLGELLPAVLQEDELLMRFTAGIDHLLAPAIAALDCIAAYVDPLLAPPDYLGWLAGWVGVDLDEAWPVEQQRAAVGGAVALHRSRGTSAGLREQLESASGGEVEIADSGGVTWSLEPSDERSEEIAAELVVVVRGGRLSQSAIEQLVDAAKPAYVVHRVQVV